MKIAIPPTFGVKPSCAFLPPPPTKNLFLMANLITVGIIKKVPKKEIKEVAKKNGYDYIFEEAATLFAGGNDVSNLIRKHLGLSVPGK